MREVNRPVANNRSASAIFVNLSGSVPLGTENVLVGDGIKYNGSSTPSDGLLSTWYTLCIAGSNSTSTRKILCNDCAGRVSGIIQLNRPDIN